MNIFYHYVLYDKFVPVVEKLDVWEQCGTVGFLSRICMGGYVPVGFFALPFILMHFSHLKLFEKNSTRRPVNSECPHVDILTKLGVENCSFRNV